MSVRVSSRLHEVVDPTLRLWLMIIDRARRDAERGSLDAIAWLWLCGAEVADFVSDGAYYNVRKFAEAQLKEHYSDLSEDVALNYGLPFHKQ